MADHPVVLGRDEELASIASFLERSHRGAGGVLLVEGDPGIGKTRLVDEVLSNAKDWSVYRAVAEELYAEKPFGLLGDALNLERESNDPQRRDLWERITRPSMTEQSVGDLRFVLAEEIVAMIENESLDVPVLIVLEDLHWADPASIMTIHRLSRQLDRLRVGLIVSFRPIPRSDELASFIESQIEERRLLLRLRSLSPAQVRSLAATKLGGEPGPKLLEHLDGAGGNPLFVQELLEGLLSEGSVQEQGDLKEVEQAISPASVHQAVLRRLRFLGEATNEMIQVAAVLGESFSLGDLATVTGRNPLDCFSALRPAVAAGFISENDERFQFRHDVVREAMYLDLPLAARRSLHLQAARALAANKSPAVEVAHHFSLGAQPGDEEAIEWLHKAARTSIAPGSSIHLYERTLHLLEPGDERATEIRMEMLRPLLLEGDAKLLSTAEGLLSLGQLTWERESMARSSLGGYYVLIDQLPEAVPHIDAVLARDDIPDYQRAHFLAMGASRAMLGAVAEGAAMARDAIALGEKLGATYAEGSGHIILGNIDLLSGDHAAAAEHARQALQAIAKPARVLPVRVGTVDVDVANVSLFAGAILASADRIDEAMEAFQTARTTYEALGAVFFQGWVHWALANIHFHTGRWDDALAEIQAASLLDPQRTSAPRPAFGDPRLEIHLRRGDLASASAAMQQAEGTLPLSPGGGWIARASALISEANGDPEAGASLLLDAWTAPGAVGLSPDIRAIGPAFARLASDHESVTPTIKEVAERALAHASDTPSVKASALLSLGIVDSDPAILEESVTAARESGRPILLAECLEAWGDISADRDRSKDAVAHLTEAIDLYETVSAARDVARVAGRLRPLGVRRGARGTRGRPTTGWESLTPAELQVVELLTEGLSNPQIGERLFISRRTVATHLSSAFRKLDVSSRAELAALAARFEGAG